MRRSRRSFSAFSLSFLDIMSCGFGAVVLLFLIIKHQVDVESKPPEYDLSLEIELLEQEIGQAQQALGTARGAAMDLDEKLAALQVEAKRALKEASAARAAVQPVTKKITASDIEELKSQLKRLEVQKRQVQAQIHERSRHIRTFTGAGNREYLTGIKLGGRRILILIDISSSMLDETIVNIIRRRNMDAAAQRRSAKWQQALATVDWISARFPPSSQYQIYMFNENVEAVHADTRGRWLNVTDIDQLNRAIADLKRVIPEGGTSLERAFMAIDQLSPKPDNVFLITDGLPTQGLSPPSGTTVTGRQRLALFEKAVTRIPRGVPVNVILLPMEGDPMAASAFWQVALYTRGSFLTPAKDWP
jgi:hypothetical protein